MDGFRGLDAGADGAKLPHMRIGYRVLLIGALVPAAGCLGRARSPEPRTTAPQDPARDALAVREEADRKELVSSPPLYWHQEPVRRQIKLVLDAEKTALHAGERFRYRLQIENVGQNDIVFAENPSFIKIGERARRGVYKILLTLPDGSESEIPPPMFAFRTPPPSERSPEAPDVELFLRLHPGEILSTRPDASSSGVYRDLATAYRFDEPGRYGIRFVYDDGDLRAESNPVAFQVVK